MLRSRHRLQRQKRQKTIPGIPIEPDVLVNKSDGKLLCFKEDGSTAPFSEHPLYAEPSTEETGFTKEDALSQLSRVSAEDLGLPAALSEYTAVFDNWTTNIIGTDCYNINVYSYEGGRRTIIGQFYVAVDGSVMYKFDALLDDFAEIKE